MTDKVLVYDYSVYGQTLCQYLEDELPIRTERIVDSADIEKMSDREIFWHVIEKIRPFIGKVIGVVIASPLVVAVAAGELEKLFPRQKFLYYGGGVLNGLRRIDQMGLNQGDKIGIFVGDRIRRTRRYQASKAACQEMEVDELDCAKWLDLLDKGWLSQNDIIEEFRHRLGMKIVLCHQSMLIRENRLREMVDWRGEIINLEKEIVLPLKQMIKNGLRG